MKNVNPRLPGKISIHGRGAGLITPEDIEARAREIAMIEGHASVTEIDRRHAMEELRGTDLDAVRDDDLDATDSLSRDPSDPPANRGHQVPNYEAADEQELPERLVAEGLDEAQHEQMLEARRRLKTP